MGDLYVHIGTNEIELYQRMMERIQRIATSHGLGARDTRDLIDLYDDLYWTKKENARLNSIVEELRDELFSLKTGPMIKRMLSDMNAAGRVGLSSLIPATYKPVWRPRIGLRQYAADAPEDTDG